MTGHERLVRVAELERVLGALIKLGWRVEAMGTTDEEGEPFRVEVHLRIEPESALGGWV